MPLKANANINNRNNINRYSKIWVLIDLCIANITLIYVPIRQAQDDNKFS